MKKIPIEHKPLDLVVPTAEEAKGWLGQGVGKYHTARLREKIAELQDDWSNGIFTGESVEETIQLNSEALGKVQAFAEVFNYARRNDDRGNR